MLAGEGMSQVVRSLQELLARRTYYSGDLLFSVDILRNVTDTFKRATYVPSADDVQVLLHSGGVCWGSMEVHTSSPIPLFPAFLPGGELHGGFRKQGQMG
jgi:hypothetical protein